MPGGCAFVVFDEAFATVLGFEGHAAPELVPGDISVSRKDVMTLIAKSLTAHLPYTLVG